MPNLHTHTDARTHTFMHARTHTHSCTVISRCHCVAPGRSAYSGGKWRRYLSLPFTLLHNSRRSCKTGCSIVNYPKSQTQHIFSPCSPCDELTDPQTYRPLSADRKTSCSKRTRKELKLPFFPSPSTMSGNLLHNKNATKSCSVSLCHACNLNFFAHFTHRDTHET